MEGNEKLKENDDDCDSGWKRLREMYSIDGTRFPSPQLYTVFQSLYMSFLGGFIVGGISSLAETHIKFMNEFETKAFRNHIEAKSQLQEVMVLSLIRGGSKFGGRLSLFTGCILTTLFTLEKYKGYSSVVDFTIAGALPCGLYNCRRGPKVFFSNVFVGGTLGTLAGVFAIAIMNFTGVTLKKIYEGETNPEDVVHVKEIK